MIAIKFLFPTESATTNPPAFLLILEAGQNPGQIPPAYEVGSPGFKSHLYHFLAVSSVPQLPHQGNGTILAFTSHS